MRALAIGVVGKLPGWADFVRLGARGAAFEHLLTWLVDGAESAAAQGRAEAGALDRGDVQAFVYRAGTSVLAGAMIPSRDQAGRCLPVAAAAEIAPSAGLARHPEALPIILEELWSAAARLVLELQGARRDGVRSESWTVELDEDTEAALHTYRDWTREMTVAELLELVFSGDRRAAAEILASVEATIAPYRGLEEPDTPLSLRLPLGASGGATVCFWLDLARRLARWTRTMPSFFWSHDGGAGALMLHLGYAPDVALAELWLPTSDHDHICDLVAPRTRHWRSDRIATWMAALDRPESPLSELLDAAQLGI